MSEIFDYQDDLPFFEFPDEDDLPGPWPGTSFPDVPPVVTWPDRYASPLYTFVAGSDVCAYLGVSTATNPYQTEPNNVLYNFVVAPVAYPGTSVLFYVDANRNIIYINGSLQEEPFSTISLKFDEVDFSIAVYTDNLEDPNELNPPIYLSELSDFGLVNVSNYSTVFAMFSGRLLGCVNVKLFRDNKGLLSVEACVVNQGVVPSF